MDFVRYEHGVNRVHREFKINFILLQTIQLAGDDNLTHASQPDMERIRSLAVSAVPEILQDEIIPLQRVTEGVRFPCRGICPAHLQGAGNLQIPGITEFPGFTNTEGLLAEQGVLHQLG